MMKGRKAFQDKLKRLADVGALADKVTYAAADMIRAEAHRSISAGSVSDKGHIPSKPGEPPNRDTGHLQNHIEASLTGPGEAQVRSEAEYAADLEFGGSKVAARPYMRPARDKSMPAINRMVATELGKHVKRSGR